jgi:hypothetical protein
MESLLNDKTRKPGKAPVSVEMKDRICKIACTQKPKNATHGSVRNLAKQVGIGKSRVNRILREWGIQPHLTETFPCSTDEKVEEKLREVVGLYMNPPDNAILLWVEEQSRIRALERIPPLQPLREHLPARQTADYERHGRTTLFAALTGEMQGTP